jgi:EH domain-containing protein 1
MSHEEVRSPSSAASSPAHRTAPPPPSAPSTSSSTASTIRAIYQNWFTIADSNGDGRVTGADAVSFFARSGLSQQSLAKVWAYADERRAGYLDFAGFCKALELVWVCQERDGELTAQAYGAEKKLCGGEEVLLGPPRLKGLVGGLHEHTKEEMEMEEAARNFTPHYSAADREVGARLLPAGTMRTNTQTREVRSFASPPVLGAGAGGTDSSNPYLAPSALTPSSVGGTSFGGLHRSVERTMPVSSALLRSSYSRAQKEGGGSKSSLTSKDVTSITEGLRSIYFSKIRGLEETYKFGSFFSPVLQEGDFEAKPSVLLLGQYSTGKSTFIKYLLGRGYPGIHIGPEPTTDRFVVVHHGPADRTTPGNTLVVQTSKPFTGLSQFGNGFLSKFQGSECDNRLLEEITLVDTPGVLSGEKQRIQRGYDFKHVCGWFASRCDLILLLFDPNKLDISDEFRSVMSTLKSHEDKVRIVLNKADQVDQQQLMRVYGALMWSLGKVFSSPEVPRVYIGSFSDESKSAKSRKSTSSSPMWTSLFEKEQEDLLHDLYGLPKISCDRRVNEFVKRVRAAKIHFLIMGHLRKQMPYFGQKKAQQRLLDRLPEEFVAVQREHHLHPGDFPDVQRYREILSAFDLSKFPKLEKGLLASIDQVLSSDLPALMRRMGNPFD